MATALILIDIQQGFDDPFWGDRNNPNAELRAADLLVYARQRSWQICHIQHISTQSGSPLTGSGISFKTAVTPKNGEAIFQKSVNSAFIGTGLETHLHEKAVNDVVICGLTTPHCVSTTTRMAANLGFRVRLVHDACAAFTSNVNMRWMPKGVCAQDTRPSAEQIHCAALGHLHAEFAQVVDTNDIISDG